jgi:hypothetical protein
MGIVLCGASSVRADLYATVSLFGRQHDPAWITAAGGPSFRDPGSLLWLQLAATASEARPVGTAWQGSPAIAGIRLCGSRTESFGGGLEPLAPQVTPIGASREVVQALPDVPGSVELFCTGLLSLGAFQLVRSTRNLYLSGMPSWYHTGGPDQIGHAVPFDFEFTPQVLCLFEDPGGERPLPLNRRGVDVVLPLDSQCVLNGTGPRAPPSSI